MSGPNDPDYFVTAPNREKHEKFFRDAFEVILKGALFEGIQRDQPVLRFKLPADMKAELNLGLESSQGGATHEELLAFLEQVIKHSVKTGHPYFVNQLYSGLDPFGVCADWAATALNGSVYTYEVAPVFTIMELEVFERMRNIIGFPPGKGDGLFCPGGSMANGYAISLARYKKRPEVKSKGLFGLKPLIMFSSEDAHYSFKKLASFQGLGADQVIGVKVDARGKMIVEELKREIEAAISAGHEPFLVAATAGTTVLGAFDPIDEIAPICAQYGLWFHVDAAWGGGTLMSDTYRDRLKGIEKADSVTWNPHKLLCAPQQCSTFLLKDEKIASEAHATNATYLFQKDKFYDASQYDTGDKHIQCGRRADVFKFWLMWKAKGKSGFEQHVDHLYSTVKYAVAEIKRRSPEFKLILEDPECTNISFWYIPPSLQHLDTDGAEFREKIHKVPPKIKERMMKAGSMMVTYQPLRTWPNFFRLVLQSSEVKDADINYFLDEIKRCGQDL
jgi:glutamate decarboxylase